MKKEFLTNLIEDIKEEMSSVHHEHYIPDIITFCENSNWLGLSCHDTNPIYLYPMQKIILKSFYRGSIGNENLELTDDEINLCVKLGLNSSNKGDVLGKYYSNILFTQLVLIWGRRASKDFITSLIALYEAMKLLECPGGDPYALYELSSANTINILTVANSKKQAQIAFTEIREKLIQSAYFQDKYMRDGIGASSIYLLTPQDKEDNKKLVKRGITSKKGSIGIIVGHSNSDSLLGMGCIVLILDEVASYKTTGGASSGDRIYAALTPTLSTYCRKFYKKNEDGEFELDENNQKIVTERIYDGKVISISSPRAQEGKFYELYNSADEAEDRLVCRLPTWEVNPTHTRESLRKTYASMSESEFNMEFGAEFSGVGSEFFFTEEQVDSCFRGHNLIDNKIGRAGCVYFCHIDPATSSHNYALIILHKQFFMNQETKKTDFMVIVDHIRYWSPSAGKPISINEVDDYVVGLKRRFHIGILTYDQWNSQQSILKLRKAGIPNKETRFTFAYKNQIYRELENLINAGKLKIPFSNLLRNEMLQLQRKFKPNGFKVFPKTEGDGVKSDDLVDALAGACYMVIKKQTDMLPTSQLVDTGITPQSNQIAWRNMQGGYYGFGTGQQVAHQLEKRNSWPNYKR